MRLAQFIDSNMEQILQAWEDFARTITTTSAMDSVALRDHAEQMLREIAKDLRTVQTNSEKIEKSLGHARKSERDSAAETHAVDRLLAGYTIEQMASEYRALRSSVLTQWLKRCGEDSPFDVEDMIRFNEAIDQALAESIARYSREADASRDIFLGILGHDLRTPLGAIMLGSEVLLRVEELGAGPTKVASRIFTSVKRANQIVNDLLDFSRLQFGAGLPLAREEGNLTALCEGMIEEVRAYNPQANIVFERCGEVVARFDAARMEQVFSNLIENAVKHGDITLPITVSLKAEQTCAFFAVHNQGPPIGKETIPVLFSPMKRQPYCVTADRASAAAGLGLGLYIAGEIVKAHEGEIEVESTPDYGTLFTVRFPLAAKEACV